MKHKLLLIFLLAVPYILQAQNDSLYHKALVEKINSYRTSRSLTPVKYYSGYNRAAAEILKGSKNLKNMQGKYNEDSVRCILRANHIYDYQFKLISSARYKDNNLKSISLNSDLQKNLDDSLYRKVTIASNENEDLIILIKEFVEFHSSKGEINIIAIVQPWGGTIPDTIDHTPPFWSIELTSPLKEVQYVGLTKMDDFSSVKSFSTARAENGMLQIAGIKQDKNYIVILHNNKIIYIYKR